MFRESLHQFLNSLKSLEANRHDIITLKINMMRLAGKLLSQEVQPRHEVLLANLMKVYRLLPESSECDTALLDYVKSEIHHAVSDFQGTLSVNGEQEEVS